MSNVAIFDGNNLALRCLHGNSNVVSGSDVDYNIWKFTIFSSIMWTLNTQAFSNINKVVLAWDQSSWRYKIYDLYKKHRKEKRDQDELDWPTIFMNLNLFIEEFREYLPFNNIRVPMAEADDIIGVLVNNTSDNFIIISQDCDYLQLYDPKRVSIFAPLKKEFKTCSNVTYYLNEMCLCGQKKDNVYNVITPFDFPSDIRKPAFGPKQAEKILLNVGLDKWLDDVGPKEVEIKSKEFKRKYGVSLNTDLRERFKLNRILLDLRIAPKNIKENIIDKYSNVCLPDPDLLYNYFLNNGWRGSIDNFDYLQRSLLRFY